MRSQVCCEQPPNKNIDMSKETRINISLRLPETLLDRADARAKELDIKRTDIIEKALRCFLGVGFEPECTNQSEIEKLKTLLKTVIEANNLKTFID
jgi:metal-responsive CopG/Arc/MetJ family transcriptional regulator